MSETGYVMKKSFSSKCSSNNDKQLQPWSKFVKKNKLKSSKRSKCLLMCFLAWFPIKMPV